VVPLCAREGVGQVVWSPLAQGVLTGKYRRGQAPPADSRAASRRMGGFIGRWLTDEVLEAVERLRVVADEAGLTMAQLALAWVLREPNVASAIVGASRPAQLEDTCAAAGRRLDAEVLAAVDKAVAGVLEP
jgi:aryl-alcohol dehydrogenase-like predicted oxidoreductase